ncbi:hypothetical protein EV06_1202 [Prochlorococcus sp. MIT 0602]|nr:hypothetical protein EV06_1202 [Prochlorococcus sp. MIT 0602]
MVITISMRTLSVVPCSIYCSGSGFHHQINQENKRRMI